MDIDKHLEIFIKNVKQRLDDGERSDAWLARKADLTPASISRLFKKSRSPNFETIVAISNALGCEPIDLIVEKQGPADAGPWKDLIALAARVPKDAVPEAIYALKLVIRESGDHDKLATPKAE